MESVGWLICNVSAARGFLTIAFDPSYTGESGGSPRYMTSPDINTEDFSAAVDFLSVQPNVDPEKIGIIGICGWGGLGLNAAAMDTRIKASAIMTMYDMSKVTANGYFDYEKDAATIKRERMENRRKLNAQRTADYKSGTYAHEGGVPDNLPDDAPDFVKQYYDYYKTKRGYHPRSLNSNNGRNLTSQLTFMNMPQLTYVDEIETPVLLVHGEKAHSRYFSEYAFEKMTGTNPHGQSMTVGNKELMIVPGAIHCDLYDGGTHGYIPFDKLESFFKASFHEVRP
ncbi:alpha/beta hydrolase [Selenomonas sp. AB3002]|uniref:alpha/beta hydrolase n=1 Tax=Selenomonas sp. AB3002 TaxID=1392502 RepID=UPI0032C20D45